MDPTEHGEQFSMQRRPVGERGEDMQRVEEIQANAPLFVQTVFYKCVNIDSLIKRIKRTNDETGWQEPRNIRYGMFLLLFGWHGMTGIRQEEECHPLKENIVKQKSTSK